MIFLSSTNWYSVGFMPTHLDIGRGVGATELNFRGICRISKKSISGLKGICQEKGVTLAEFSESMILGINLYLYFWAKGIMRKSTVKKNRGYLHFTLTNPFSLVIIFMSTTRKKEYISKRGKSNLFLFPTYPCENLFYIFHSLRGSSLYMPNLIYLYYLISVKLGIYRELFPIYLLLCIC